MVNATGLWQAYLEFEPSAVRHVKSVEAQTSSRWCGVEIRRGGVPAQVSSSSLSLDHGSNLRDSAKLIKIEIYEINHSLAC
ncbi:hypothetical protein TNCV_2189021 [Trichonephila clavipes]|nr:hypothetical protein TNCV_2189021 [Trichonephila clavipes]